MTKCLSKVSHQVIAIQARMGSHRLPGKALAVLNGIPVLAWCIGQCLKSDVQEVVVTTSEYPEDDPIVELAQSVGIRCFRGSRNDLIDRLRRLTESIGAEKIVRISGDSPFIDPTLINIASRIGATESVELVTNVMERTFPKGQSVEVLSRSLLERLASQDLDEFNREHVTSFVYDNPDQYSIINFESGGDFGRVQLSIDTQSDLEAMRFIAELTCKSVGGWRELVRLRSTYCAFS